MWWLWPPGAPGGWWPSWWPGWQSPLRTLPLRWKPPLTWPWRFWNCLRDFSWKIINLVAVVGENNFPVLWTVIGRLHDFQIYPILFRSHGITWTKRTVYQVWCAPHTARALGKITLVSKNLWKAMWNTYQRYYFCSKPNIVSALFRINSLRLWNFARSSCSKVETWGAKWWRKEPRVSRLCSVQFIFSFTMVLPIFKPNDK